MGRSPMILTWPYWISTLTRPKARSAFLFLPILCAALTFAAPASAQVALSFTFIPGLVDRTALRTYLKSVNKPELSSFDIAGPDLNKDGLREFVLRPKGCTAATMGCTYLILAEKRQKIIALGEITAQKVILSPSFSHGIQDFLAFQSDTNDYEYVRYAWSPSEMRYTLAEPQKTGL
jgi:hypothetical protein